MSWEHELLTHDDSATPHAGTLAVEMLPGAVDPELDPRLLPGPALWVPRVALAEWASDPGDPPAWRGFRLVTDPTHWELVGPTDPGVAIAVTGSATATLVRPTKGGRGGETAVRGIAMTLPARRVDRVGFRAWEQAVAAGSVLLVTSAAIWDLTPPTDHREALTAGWWAAHTPVLSVPERPLPRPALRRRRRDRSRRAG
ncbi:hypothetical protein [Actinomycetospora termitidis]|uniref:Uncharacterized protein n=1 Tax=Actinomycetospora termitidis TaxID=3053470 RepID=A0ABT7MKB1_9PSEU|nr:hypothetical protein [Actinomycetospora sp. Odt1-22]MDL5160422.1 hypothetical protein [Actinomycetospora sp. Odt1-22]